MRVDFKKFKEKNQGKAPLVFLRYKKREIRTVTVRISTVWCG